MVIVASFLRLVPPGLGPPGMAWKAQLLGPPVWLLGLVGVIYPPPSPDHRRSSLAVVCSLWVWLSGRGWRLGGELHLSDTDFLRF